MNVSSHQEACRQKSRGKDTRVLFRFPSHLEWRLLILESSLWHLLLREIWARFLAFESNIGDLASILKVERRRFAAFKDEYEGKETALLVDRYKFMDLYPCSASELKALGYKVSFYTVCRKYIIHLDSGFQGRGHRAVAGATQCLNSI